MKGDIGATTCVHFIHCREIAAENKALNIHSTPKMNLPSQPPLK